MFRLVPRLIALAALVVVLGNGLHSQGSPWIFEGLISKADPKLAPDLQSGWVLSGSFIFTALEMEEEIPPDAYRSGRFSGGISEAELTVDLYHQLHFEALQVPGMAGFDYTDNDPENDGRDLYGWFIPMRGNLKETEWSSRWLQIWLSDSEGDMIRSVPPVISPYGLKAEAIWFRLTMENESGEKAFVEGNIDYFGPLEGASDSESDWRGVAAGLSEQLIERDRTILSLREELARARARINSLRQMVDIMVEERRTLQEENRLLAEHADQVDPEVEVLISGFEADKALLEEELNTLSDRNLALAESLAESEQLRWELVRKLQSIEKLVEEGNEEEPEATESAVIVPVVSQAKEEAVDKPAATVNPVQEPEPTVMESRTPARESPPPPPRKRRIGPRKFR